tara:strand:- start:136 stop:291 length:156 start_codon:yes stop_codon:yes gene_type:complete
VIWIYPLVLSLSHRVHLLPGGFLKTDLGWELSIKKQLFYLFYLSISLIIDL